jgi:hypothetical protein
MTSRQPTHIIWAVQKNGDKGFWTSIGAAWTHEDDDGRSLKLNLLPRAGHRRPQAQAQDRRPGR